MTRLIHTFNPEVVVMDPITNLVTVGLAADVKSMLTRLVDYLKTREITAFFTSLSSSDDGAEQTDIVVSSLMDTWIVLKDIQAEGERNHGLTIVKSRGMAHSNQTLRVPPDRQRRPPGGCLSRSAGCAHRCRRAGPGSGRRGCRSLARAQEMERQKRQIERKRSVVEPKSLLCVPTTKQRKRS